MSGQVATSKSQPQWKVEGEGIGKKKATWKPIIENLNDSILKKGNLKKLLQYYDRYPLYEKRSLNVILIQYMIKFKKPLPIIHGELPKELYERLNKERLRIKKEEETLTEDIIRRCYNVSNNVQ